MLQRESVTKRESYKERVLQRESVTKRECETESVSVTKRKKLCYIERETVLQR